MTRKNANIINKILAFLYLAALIYITLLMGDRYGALFENDNFNLIPFSGKRAYFENFFTIYNNERWFVIKEIGGNFLLFMPFAWFSDAVFNKGFSVIRITLIITISVLAVEILQYVLHIGTFDIDDIILNISGGITGIFIFKALKKRLCR